MKRKILIVEDSLTVRRMLTQAISQQTGLEIDAFDTLEGARDCQGEEYVVALVDLTLPDAPSGEAVNVLLEHGLPVVILTADISEEKREAWLEAGVLDYVMKDSRHSLQYAVSLVHRLYLNQAIEVLVSTTRAPPAIAPLPSCANSCCWCTRQPAPGMPWPCSSSTRPFA